MIKKVLFNLLLINSALLGDFEDSLNIRTNSLTLKEKIGHLFMIGIYQKETIEELQHYLDEYQVSNLLFVGRNWKPERQKEIIAEVQSGRKNPLLIAEDLEYGLNQRMDEVIVFPRNMTLGAIQDENLIYEMGKEVGRECRVLGVALNFSPVVDVNTNPLNPVINVRSFGDNSERVARYGEKMMLGLQSQGVKTAAKHFPGHGNVSVDSHYDMPIAEYVELSPFIHLIKNKVDCVLTSHLVIPSFDPDYPVSLSKKWINFLKNELQFKGLIITDDLLMKAMRDPYKDRALKAFLAGNHILLFTEVLPESRQAFIEGYNAIYEAVLSGIISTETLNQRVKEILAFKETIKGDQLNEPLYTEEATNLRNRLYKSAITRVNSFPILEPIQVMTNPLEPITGKTIVYAGSPYHLPLLPQDRAIILAYEVGGIEQALNAIKENAFPGKLPISFSFWENNN